MEPSGGTARERGLSSVLRRITGTAPSRSSAGRAPSDGSGPTPCGELRDGRRERVQLVGTIGSVTLRPRGDTPALEAELYDATGSVTLVWLGRREIRGIEAGRSMRAEGLVACKDGTRTMFNPTYELVAGTVV